MKKKLAALVLAATMVIGTGLTAFAAETQEANDMAAAADGKTITGDATMQLPVISVTVPTTADFVINPFQMKYTDAADAVHYDQIISAPQEILNDSNVAIAVNVADLTATDVKDGVLISTTALTSKVTTKSAFLYLEVVEDGKEFAAAYDSKAANQVVIPYVKADDTKAKKGAKDGVVVLEAKQEGADAGTKALFKIGGSVVANPTKVNEDKTVSAAPWTDGDAFGISFKFTFTPQIVGAPTENE